MEFDTLPAFAQNTISAFRNAANTGLQEVRSAISANAGTVNIAGSDFDFAALIGASIDTQDSLLQAGTNNIPTSQPISGTTTSNSPSASNVNVMFEPAEGSFGGQVILGINGQTLGFNVGSSNSLADGSSLVITPAPGVSFDISSFLSA